MARGGHGSLGGEIFSRGCSGEDDVALPIHRDATAFGFATSAEESRVQQGGPGRIELAYESVPAVGAAGAGGLYRVLDREVRSRCLAGHVDVAAGVGGDCSNGIAGRSGQVGGGGE